MDLEDYFYAHLQELRELIRIPSVYDGASAAPDKPYGKGVAAALEYMRQLACSDGFEVLEFDGKAIGIRIKGDDSPGDSDSCSRDSVRTDCSDSPSQDSLQVDCSDSSSQDPAHAGRIDIASHLDVVEPGSGWTVDPFGALIRDGKLYGRGSQDMKTSAFLTYLALKKLRGENTQFHRELRIVLGCDEERTMEDLACYIKKAGLPDFAFTPDGVFPMAIGEKGALMWRLAGSYRGPVEEMDCGVQCNVIPPAASARIRGNRVGEIRGAMEDAQKEGIRIEGTVDWIPDDSEAAGGKIPDNAEGTAGEWIPGNAEGTTGEWIPGNESGNAGDAGDVTGNTTATATSAKKAAGYTLLNIRGKAAHASRPQNGHSATADLLYLLGKIDPLMDNLYRCFHDPYGSRFCASIKKKEASEQPQPPFSPDNHDTPERRGDRGLTVNLGVFRLKNGVCYGEVDGRYPFGMDSGELTRRLAEACALDVSLDYDSPPAMNEKEDIFVSALLQTYREQTGDQSEPVISGGVSYSKIYGHCVAFGPIFPWMKDLAHQADENIALKDCVKAFEIYYEAMKKLAVL